MSIDKTTANKVLTNLDRTASTLEGLAKSGKVNKAIVAKLVGELDAFADKFQVAAFGAENFRKHQAKVLESDSDEPFMKTFDAPQKVLEGDSDEPYMKTFDQDQTESVTNRDEFQIKDISEHADGTKKQPSWKSGPKSHKASAPARPKTWAP